MRAGSGSRVTCVPCWFASRRSARLPGSMRLIGLAVVLTLNLMLPPAGEAQPAGKVHRIGVLVPGTAASAAPLVGVFRQALGELGYVEGQNFLIELRYAETAEALGDTAIELTRLNLDVIIAPTTTTAVALKRATRTIPIVVVVVGDPVQSGLIGSLARPGGNLTGNAVLYPELTVKQLELLRETSSRLSRILVLGNWSNPSTPPIWDSLQSSARGLSVRLNSIDVRAPEDFDTALVAAMRQRPDAILALTDPLILFRAARLAEFALSNRLPSISFFREFALAGGLMSYGPNLVELVRRSAWYVDKILKGTKPADLPVEQPTKFELVINLKTAKALGLTIPPSVLGRADQIIE
jgi:putative ABC transport system substrate-binding protein